MSARIYSEASEESAQIKDKVSLFAVDPHTQGDAYTVVDDIVEADDNPNDYSESEIKDIFDKCVSLGICHEHEAALTILLNELRDTEEVYIGDLCSAAVNRKMWWNASTPLMIACLEGGATLTQVLLLLGADVCATNELKSTGRKLTHSLIRTLPMVTLICNTAVIFLICDVHAM